MSAPSTPAPRRHRSRGQSLVEFSLVVPLFLMILFGMMEFGFIFTHEMTLEYATREGARAGAALANGGGTLTCGSGDSPNWTQVDPEIIAAVERVLTSPGSQVVVSRVTQIVIFKANPNTGANDQGFSNTWLPGTGPVPTGATNTLQFADGSYPNSDGWRACLRSNAAPTPDSIGVSLTYTYDYVTPLGSILRFFGGSGAATLTLTDQTVMQLNPTTTTS
ncbi:MAG: TadE/TadG family type IV pilus assembly protein [Candidatus Limnocylindrales bacterium]